jgi:hypothetical protein
MVLTCTHDGHLANSDDGLLLRPRNRQLTTRLNSLLQQYEIEERSLFYWNETRRLDYKILILRRLLSDGLVKYDKVLEHFRKATGKALPEQEVADAWKTIKFLLQSMTAATQSEPSPG